MKRKNIYFYKKYTVRVLSMYVSSNLRSIYTKVIDKEFRNISINIQMTAEFQILFSTNRSFTQIKTCVRIVADALINLVDI